MYMKEIREQFFDDNETNDKEYLENMAYNNRLKEIKTNGKPEISNPNKHISRPTTANMKYVLRSKKE